MDAGGVANADHVARWDGSAWQAVGGGLNDRVCSFAFDASGNLYAGGQFIDAGGDPDADHIAVLNGSRWKSLGGSGSGTNGIVYALIFDDRDNLIISGNFSNAGGDSHADGIAIWGIGTWTALGNPEGGVHLGCPYGLAFDADGRLVAGGSFQSAGQNTPGIRYIAAWDQNIWEEMTDSSLDEGGGLSDEVRALGFDAQGKLVAGGYFENAGNNENADYIARWDGSSWQPIGDASSKIDSYVNAIITDASGRLVAGGEFLDAGGDADADNIAVWDGTSWSSLNGAGSGLSSYVYSLALSKDGLIYAGGEFDDAGGDPDADYLAAWDGVSWSAVGGSSSVVDDIVYDLTFDQQGNLYIVGEFYGVAVWDGTDWTGAVLPEGEYDLILREATGASSDSIIVDNSDPEYTEGGVWTTGTYSGGWGADYRWCNSGGDIDWAHWTPTLPSDGYYDVYIWYLAGTNRCDSVLVRIVGVSDDTVRIDQQINGSQWFHLGRFAFPASGGYVGINDDGAIGGDVVVADAVLWVYDGPLRVFENRVKPSQLSVFAYPNPFNSFVSIALRGVGASGSQSRSLGQIAHIGIFDMNGHRVGDLPPPSTSLTGSVEGPTPLIWRPGESIPSGVYLIRVRLGATAITKRILYLK